MTKVTYTLGTTDELEKLYPPAKYANKDVGLKDYPDVISHYTNNSLIADGFENATVKTRKAGENYELVIEASDSQKKLDRFAKRHQVLFGAEAGTKAITGMNIMKELGVWNPMDGFHVNESPSDGKSKWHLFPPLGLNVIGQKGILLMHYPPWQVLQQASFLKVMTMFRWNTVLMAVGVPKDELSFYRTFCDVNPIAAPGSGESEYPNDYFPIMMASAFFDGGKDRDYIRSMLDLYLNPPGLISKKYTLPLLVCGSPLYDPQAPGWFRVAYKNDLPTVDNKKDGIVSIDVLQAGEFKVRPDSKKATPYLVANHMIAAGVTGKCTADKSKIPDIRKYEAQDSVAATFLRVYADNPDISPEEAKKRACQRWFGNPTGEGAANPKDPKDRQKLCALAQMDSFFVGKPSPHSKYTWEEALKRCKDANNGDDPCASPIGPAEGAKSTA